MKKKKTVHLRKKRVKNQNRIRTFRIKNFYKISKRYFYNKYKKQKRSFYRFLINFYGLGHVKVQYFVKLFGMPLNYKIIRKIKKNIYITQNNFRFLKKTLKKRRFRNFFIIKTKFFKKFNYLKKIKKLKYKNIRLKRQLTLFFSYRHLLQLPVRGQRTKTNAKTRKNFNIL